MTIFVKKFVARRKLVITFILLFLGTHYVLAEPNQVAVDNTSIKSLPERNTAKRIYWTEKILPSFGSSCLGAICGILITLYLEKKKGRKEVTIRLLEKIKKLYRLYDDLLDSEKKGN